MNRGEKPGPIFQFTANDLFRITGTKAAGTAYDRLEGALNRLKCTTIKTNLLDDDGEGGETAASPGSTTTRSSGARTGTARRSMQSVRVMLGSTALQRHHEEQAHPDLRQPVFPTEAAGEKAVRDRQSACRRSAGLQDGHREAAPAGRLATDLRFFKSKLQGSPSASSRFPATA